MRDEFVVAWLLVGSIGAVPACVGEPPAESNAGSRAEPAAVVTGPAIATPLVLPQASTYREILASDLRAEDTWALSLGPRFRVVVDVDGKELQAHVYPYARMHFPAPFVYVPPGQVHADGTRVRPGWLRVPVGVLYRLQRAGLPSRREARAALS